MQPASTRRRAESRATDGSCRGDWSKQTCGLAPVYVQRNLAILPAEVAADFHRFRQKNTKSCPLPAVSDVHWVQYSIAVRGRSEDVLSVSS
jgi:uncharacterized protein YcsI (UPF0317 family)